MVLEKHPLLDMVESANLAFSNSLNHPDLLAAAASAGFDQAALQQGLDLCSQAREAITAQNLAEGEQEQATAQMNEARRHAERAYQRLAQSARAIFLETPAHLEALGITREMPTATDPFIGLAKTAFLAALQPGEIADALAAVELDPATLQEGLQVIETFDAVNQQQEVAKSATQQATQVQQAALDELYPYYAKFIKLMRVALREDRQLLEALQVPARTSPTQAEAAARRRRRDA
jgi:hypothetical protein